MQLAQIQEELGEISEKKSEIEKLYKTYKARYERVEKRLPQYSDYGDLQISRIDTASDNPLIIWKVKEFLIENDEPDEFIFAISLHDDQPGIGLVIDERPLIFSPKLLGSDRSQASIFLNYSTKQFRMLISAIQIFEKLESSNWIGVELLPEFDLGFWRPFIKNLIFQFKQLPLVLRYDEVKLKRELINPDYEHLWLEFYELTIGKLYWKKFEIRLGAALIEENGFSKYPKFEIPLIDGKSKPFDSWFAESRDDSGPKLELRFSLEKKVFDVAVWSKLSDEDRVLILRLIYAMPNALRALEKEKEILHRPIKVWIDFAKEAVKVMESKKDASRTIEQSKTKPEGSIVPDGLVKTASSTINESRKVVPSMMGGDKKGNPGKSNIIINISGDYSLLDQSKSGAVLKSMQKNKISKLTKSKAK